MASNAASTLPLLYDHTAIAEWMKEYPDDALSGWDELHEYALSEPGSKMA